MTYAEKKKLIEAANLLKENCRKKYKDGCDCVFANGDVCILAAFFPSEWEIPKITRWTPEDIALAKALKAAGAEVIYNSNGKVSWRTDNIYDCGLLPCSAFINMLSGESIDIDAIIKEAKEK